MKKSTNIALRLAALLVVFAVPSFAADTAYDTVEEIKVFNTYVNVVLTNETHACGGGSGTHFKLPISDSEKIRLIEAAWLAGKDVSLEYTCNGSNADVSAARAK